jgi:hypothetical protein
MDKNQRGRKHAVVSLRGVMPRRLLLSLLKTPSAATSAIKEFCETRLCWICAGLGQGFLAATL